VALFVRRLGAGQQGGVVRLPAVAESNGGEVGVHQEEASAFLGDLSFQAAEGVDIVFGNPRGEEVWQCRNSVHHVVYGAGDDGFLDCLIGSGPGR
jgi:hypothetical protein